MANKGYPKTKFSIEDKTADIEVNTNSVGSNMPLAMQAFTSDRGPEDWTIITSLKDFIKQYGEISYVRHGQPQLTVAEILKAGGAVLGKRLVGEDATLANITICAKVVKLEQNDFTITNTADNVTTTKTYTGNNNTNYVYFYAKDGYTEGNTVIHQVKTFDEAIRDYVSIENTSFSTYTADQLVAMDDFPLFTITAVGRGVSNLSFSIDVNHNANNSFPEYLLYTFNIYRNNEKIEQINFSFNPNITINNVSYAMNPKINLGSSEIRIKNYENSTEAFAAYLAISTKTSNITANAVNMTKNDIINSDFINGKDRTGTVTLGNLITHSTDEKISCSTKVGDADATTALEDFDIWSHFKPNNATIPANSIIQPNGSSIKFSFSTASSTAVGTNDINFNDEAPIKKAFLSESATGISVYENLLLNAFGKKYDASTGKIETLKSNKEIISDQTTVIYNQFDPVIYDVDKYKVDFTCDNGYPLLVKRAITELVDFRGDMVYIADIGNKKLLNANSIISKAQEIFTKTDTYDYRSKFVALYHNVFDIYDPYSGKQITVTMPYLIASKLVTHIANGAGRPFAGMLHDITFPEIIRNSINYIPRITPYEDSKQLLVNNNINYLSMYNELCVMETMYVNQPDYTQLSYLNNIMAIQHIIKAIRNRCPASRYTFMDGNDLERYIEDANNIINQYNSYFKSISITYMADEAYEANNIFYAVLKVQFKNFIQEEYFKIIAIS